MKGEGFIPNKDFGRGTIGPSLLDYERAGMPQFKSPDRNPFKWGKEVLKRASQSIVLAATLNGGLPANAAVPLPDVPAGINHVDNILELPTFGRRRLRFQKSRRKTPPYFYSRN